MMGWMAPLRHLGAKLLSDLESAANREPSMGEVTTIGLDLAKHVFQVHGVDAEGAAVLRKQLRRGQVLSTDAEAICEAVMRPTMRFVPVKTAEQQGALLLHRARERLVRQRTRW
jgi:transposase